MGKKCKHMLIPRLYALKNLIVFYCLSLTLQCIRRWWDGLINDRRIDGFKYDKF